MARVIATSHQTADATVLTGEGKFYGIIITATSANGGCKVYDNTASSGTVILDHSMATANDSLAIILPHPRPVHTGIRVDVTNAKVTVLYS